MTTSRSLSWIDRGRWAGLLAKATEEPALAGWASPPAQVARAGSAATARSSPPPRAASPARPPPVTAPPVRPRRVTASRLAGASPSAAPIRHRSDTLPLPNLPPLPPARPAGYRAFAPSSQQLEERLQALVVWIEDCVPCHAAFVADDNGLPVVEHLGTESGHVAAASSILAMLASVRALVRGSGGWLALELGAGVLNVVEVATRWGRFGIGVVTDDPLPREFLVVLSAAVERAFHGEPSQGEAT